MPKQTTITSEKLTNMSKTEKDALRKQLYALIDKTLETPTMFTSSSSIGFKLANAQAGIVAGGEVGKVQVSVNVVVIGSKDPDVAAEGKAKRAQRREVLQAAGL